MTKAADSPGSKLRGAKDLGTISERLKTEGKRVVLAHGTFDLLHMGHMKHLESARREGDVLMVTLTADRYVNKGPGRPIFSQNMRAEMLAALACVDYVGINDAVTSEHVLELIRPDIYVKGPDYVNARNDVTGNIDRERETVERHGGRVIFTDDVTLSSTMLINRHLDVFEPSLRAYLDRQREAKVFEEITELLERANDYRVLIVGDTIIDEYQYVHSLGKSPKENMIATRFADRELFAGGVIAAANHVASLCRDVQILTCLGEGDPYEHLVRDALAENVTLNAIYRPGHPTTRKCRFVEAGYLRKLFEVYFFQDEPLSGELEARMIANINKAAADADLVIVTDFGHGLITPRIIETLTQDAKFLAINTQTNSANTGFNLITKYSRADYICIDAPEAALAVSDRHSPIKEIAGRLLPQRIDCANIIVTAGRNGCCTYNREDGVTEVPVFTRTVVDTVGAGDAFFVVTAPLVAAGARMATAGFVGNVAGAIKVGIVGHRENVKKSSLLKYMQTLLK
jgi:rfaE bifunctional protein kinase chain/domain/rfaE bifunctional protein nucleotidyltransferase chain/domain